MNLKEFCQVSNIDYNEVIQRFMGNEGIYLKFIKRFSEEPTYDNIQKALVEENQEEIFRNTHTLKGIASNLGLNEITKISSEMCEETRNQNGDLEKLNQMNEELKKEYQKIIEAISKLD